MPVLLASHSLVTLNLGVPQAQPQERERKRYK